MSKDISSTTSNKPTPESIVCVYTQDDEPFYRELQIHLNLWQRERYIQWLEVSAGSDVEHTMKTYLQQAHLILLLISPNFFAQDRYYQAMQISLHEQVLRQVPVVPVLARASDWKMSECGSLHALPDNEQPIAEWVHPEQAYEKIRSGLARLLPSDMNFRQKLMQETAHSRTDPTSTREREEVQKPQSDGVNIVNQASNYGAQGVFNGPINFNQH